MIRVLFTILLFALLTSCSNGFAPEEEEKPKNSAPTAIATLYIEVEGGAEVLTKEYYNATLSIDGAGCYDSVVDIPTRIKGRGNSTWKFDKKPYKLKLDDAQSLLGYAPEKDWVLLANHIDPTLMLNSMAMKAGEMFGCQHVNRVVPVDVYINDTYRGAYAFTEQVEVKPNRVSLNDGYLLEIDTNFDEEWQYRSPILAMPVMLKDGEYVETEEELFNSRVVPDFDTLEAAIASDEFPNNGYEELVDLRSVASLLLVSELMRNKDTLIPRSLFLFREKGDKFRFGPIWDFDWCTGYSSKGAQHFNEESVESSIFKHSMADDGILERVDFTLRFFLDPNFVAIYKEVWSEFYTRKAEFFSYMDDYATTLEPSANTNFELWDAPNGRTFYEEYQRMREWFEHRIEYLNSTILNYI